MELVVVKSTSSDWQLSNSMPLDTVKFTSSDLRNSDPMAVDIVRLSWGWWGSHVSGVLGWTTISFNILSYILFWKVPSVDDITHVGL